MIKSYARGSYNKYNDTEQWIRISEGCPNNCEFCRETKECGTKPTYLPLPQIVRNNVKIMDMNLMYKKKALSIINDLGNIKINGKVVYYELICGIDYRFMNQEKANTLKQNRFQNIRFAWDHSIKEQYKIKDCYNQLIKAGYSSKSLMCFMICDWKIPFEECFMKLMLLKNWNIKVSDCWYDNVTPPNYQCNYWTMEQCIFFRALCAIHNQSVTFGIYPDMNRMYRCIDKFKNILRKDNMIKLK